MPNEDLQRTKGGNPVFGKTTGAAYRVNTIAELRAVDVSLVATGQVVEVLGYYSSTDGAGGLFSYSLSSILSDNGGTVIAPTSGAGRWLRIVSGAYDYRWFGAKGDSVTDDITAINACITAAAGAPIEPSKGIYCISAPIDLGTGATIRAPGKRLYPNFTTDWQTVVPSWGYTAVTIQYVAGSHGAIFKNGQSSDLSGLVIRSGQARTSADKLWNGTPPSFVTMMNCTVQNIDLLGYDNAVSWGGWVVMGNTVIGCGGGNGGVLVDCRFSCNTWTSTAGTAFVLTSGAGVNVWAQNRFEFGQAALEFQVGCRQNQVLGNVFDSHSKYAVLLNQCDAGQNISNNLFWRNGTTNDATLSNCCHIYIIGGAGGHYIVNAYKSGTPDGGGTATPKNIIGMESVATAAPSVFGGLTREGCTTSNIFADRYGTSVRVFNIPNPIALPAGALAGTATDDFASAVALISTVSVNPTVVDVYENRKVVAYGNAYKVSIRGIGAAITLTNDSGAFGFLSMDTISYGGLAYAMRRGFQYTTAAPNGFGDNGVWQVGDSVFDSAAAAGGKIGWVKTAAGSPDTWKQFGAIDP